jgi:hypothetical protein
MKRPKLTPKEMEERRKAMMVNASWRFVSIFCSGISIKT